MSQWFLKIEESGKNVGKKILNEIINFELKFPDIGKYNLKLLTFVSNWVCHKKQKFVLHGHNEFISCTKVTGDLEHIISCSKDTSLRI